MEVVAPHPLNLLCLACRGDDLETANRRTDAWIEAANATGDVLFTRTVLDGRSVLRFSIGASRTGREDVAQSWKLLGSLLDGPDGARGVDADVGG